MSVTLTMCVLLLSIKGEKYFLLEFQNLFPSHLATLWVFIIIEYEPAGFQLMVEMKQFEDW